MSAYNRKVLKKMGSATESDSAMDESGYSSFKVLHNSTVQEEAPFLLFERDSETENCRNATNRLHNNSRVYQSSSIDCGLQSPGLGIVGHDYSNRVMYHSPSNAGQDYSHVMMQAVGEGEEEMEVQQQQQNDTCKSPALFHSQSHSQPLGQCINKRRKSHHQLMMAHHSSPKKSKKKLFPAPPDQPSCRTRYYNGLEKLDIIEMLINTQPALECILSKLNSMTLHMMTKVSERWKEAVYSSPRRLERLQIYRYKLSQCKENTPSWKSGHLHSLNKILVPLQTSNAIYKRGHNNKNLTQEDPSLMEQVQRTKCPRCGRASKIYSSRVAAQESSQTPHPTRIDLSQTLPHAYSFSEPKPKSLLTRFYSLDELKNESKEQEQASDAFSFGECISVVCKFRFCLHCYCPPHPGTKCLITELGTPSKVMMPSERVTPPKRNNQKFDSKLSRKKSLKRLNF